MMDIRKNVRRCVHAAPTLINQPLWEQPAPATGASLEVFQLMTGQWGGVVGSPLR